jgi:hypothetical protein
MTSKLKLKSELAGLLAAGAVLGRSTCGCGLYYLKTTRLRL